MRSLVSALTNKGTNDVMGLAADQQRKQQSHDNKGRQYGMQIDQKKTGSSMVRLVLSHKVTM